MICLYLTTFFRADTIMSVTNSVNLIGRVAVAQLFVQLKALTMLTLVSPLTLATKLKMVNKLLHSHQSLFLALYQNKVNLTKLVASSIGLIKALLLLLKVNSVKVINSSVKTVQTATVNTTSV